MWLDLIFVAIIALCMFLAVKKGFVRSLIEVVGYVLAIILAFSFSGVVAQFVYDNVVEKPLVTAIDTAIVENSDNAMEKLPDYMLAIVDKAEIDINALLSAGNTDSNAIATQVADIIEPLTVGIFKTVASILIFVVLLIVVKILAKIINSMFKGAVFGTANKLLGGALGLIKGIVIAAVFCMVTYFISSISTTDILIFTDETIENSLICKHVIEFIVGAL